MEHNHIYPESGTFAFPSIWYNYERDSLGLATSNRSKAYSFVEETDSKSSVSNQKPYFTLWSNQNMNNTSAWKRQEYYNMVMNIAKTNKYWLSSRFALPFSPVECYFGFQYIISSGVNECYMYEYSYGKPKVSKDYNGIRPIVSIPLKGCEIVPNVIEPNTFNITIK